MKNYHGCRVGRDLDRREKKRDRTVGRDGRGRHDQMYSAAVSVTVKVTIQPAPTFKTCDASNAVEVTVVCAARANKPGCVAGLTIFTLLCPNALTTLASRMRISFFI